MFKESLHIFLWPSPGLSFLQILIFILLLCFADWSFVVFLFPLSFVIGCALALYFKKNDFLNTKWWCVGVLGFRFVVLALSALLKT
ncbi:MAG: hypothetical protein H7A33_08060 [Deltaproteobacteria bacterium]|nr:hypothetical protein [Deltaproteobacteria bacterium]